ncbi:MAG: retroviral-like aspartic protease family protein [Opitutaceae bacterium]|jgi:hypothetical protein|nr:retroviral-like aspartic protease family protein [Opitutaceae bacterium]
MRTPRKYLFVFAILIARLPGAELVLTDAVYGKINTSGLDQPRLYVLVSDPEAGGGFVTWDNPATGEREPALLRAFVDTGASGIAISYLHATGEGDQADLGLAAEDYRGVFTEIGIGGSELGNVARPLGLWVRNDGVGVDGELSPVDFVPYGDFNFWVRREAGAVEVTEIQGFPLVSPINLVGMPVIRQRRLLLDPTAMAQLEPLRTVLLAPGESEPDTEVTVGLVLRDFIGDVAPPGEVLPSHSANPLVPGMTLHHGAGEAAGEWLLDTGAGSTFVSFAQAKAAGLIPAQYADLAAFMADYTGPTVDVGGIGAALKVPRLTAERITVRAREGVTLVWENVSLLVADVAGLDGIFGMNLLVPAVTVDPADPLGSLFDISPGPFDAIVIDTTHAANPVMRLGAPAAAGTPWEWLALRFSAAERQDPALAGLAADPDGDGLANLVEYALDLDPRSPAGAGAPVAGRVRAGDDLYLELHYTRPVGGRAGVVCHAELSRDLRTWSRSAADVAVQAIVPDAQPGRERVTVRAAAPLRAGEALYLRLAVELAAEGG